MFECGEQSAAEKPLKEALVAALPPPLHWLENIRNQVTLCECPVSEVLLKWHQL